MSGDKNKPNPYEAEHQAANKQNGALDAFTGMTSPVSPFGSVRGFHFGKTSFEGHDLNEMIDIVESAGPALLEVAATALVDARDAIKEAADELKKNLGEVDWEGEAHRAFSAWGQNLVTTAHDLAGYADVVGTQIMAAGSGLASVRKSMPPRDSRSERKTVDDIPEARRVDSNDEYTAAVKAEKHRQEAINQMYRLASFYTVSHGTMAKAEEPVFPRMPDVGVPQPTGYRPDPGNPTRTHPAQGADGAATGTGATGRHFADPGGVQSRSQELLPPVEEGGVSPGGQVGTEIDSVGTLPAQETVRPTTATPPSTGGPGGNSTGPVPLVGPAAGPPVARGSARPASGFNGMPGTGTPASAQGRAGGIPGSTPAGRTGTGPMGPAGRAAVPGQSVGRTAGPVGRGVVGGTPRPGGSTAGRSGGAARGPLPGTGATHNGRTGIGRIGVGRTTDGVVGGKPVTGGTDAKGGRLPRGTVVGGTDTVAARDAGERPGRRGVIGAPGSTAGAGQEPRRPVGSPDGVIGTPKEPLSGVRNGGHTPGGAGSRPAGNQGSGEKRSRRDAGRDGASTTD
jgi:hypothetical protein